ncbi:hypothetical protein BFG04_04700 [Campylobacter pinnipediorum subsp. pinnipediorum]|uniref:ABC transporter permease n=2 Tax=Campylobacter TaxID=194 RepID=A0AAX0L993_9BACT|nr:hypothetical protein BFG04_04700 [Campylobacter pinnipediorum subsp. pinnipediorum]
MRHLSDANNTDKIVLDIFLKEIKSNNFNVSKTIEFIKYNLADKRNFNYLDEKNKTIIKKIYNNLKELQKDNINCFSENFFKDRILNLKIFIKLLKKQKEIIKEHIYSISKTECKRLNIEILEYENSIYNTFYPMFSRYIDLQKYSFEHLKNSLAYDFVSIVKYAKKKFLDFTLFASIIFIIIGIFVYNAYLNLNSFKYSINLLDFKDIFLVIGCISILYVIFIICLLVSSNYFLTKTNMVYIKKRNWKKIFFKISRLSLFLIILLPFIAKNDKINNIVNFNSVFEYFDYIIGFQFSLLLIYFLIYCFNIKNNISEFILNFLLFYIFFLIDFLLIYLVYMRFYDINPVILFFTLLFYFLAQFISCYHYFEYKISAIFNLFALFPLIFLISPEVMKYSGIGNYRDNFTIKKEFIPKSVSNLPYCFSDYNFTCIDKDMTNGNQVTLNNLFVRLKKDNAYYLRADMPIKYDFNLSNMNISECSQEQNTTCYENLDDNKTIEIKNYDIKFKDFKNSYNKTIFKDFKIKESDILN